MPFVPKKRLRDLAGGVDIAEDIDQNLGKQADAEGPHGGVQDRLFETLRQR